MSPTSQHPLRELRDQVAFFGTGGLTARSCQREIVQLLSWEPDVVFLIIGGNDVGTAPDVSEVVDSVTAIRQQLLDFGCRRVFVAEIARRSRDRYCSAEEYSSLRCGINRLLRKVIGGADLVDLHRRWRAFQQFADGVHANAAGNNQLLGLIFSCFKSEM